MRNCPICGTEIPINEHTCLNCGSDYPQDFFDPGYVNKAVFNNPSWGEFSIKFDSFDGDKKVLFERIKDFWCSCEKSPTTHLALFRGQFESIELGERKIVLYSPEEIYLLAKKEFSGELEHGLNFHYKRLPLEEITDQQKTHFLRK